VPPSPAPQIGDYDILRYDTGGPMSGIFQTKMTVCDWDGDGRPDIIAGDQLGRMTFYRRLGKDPYAFDVPRPLEVDGKPLRVSRMCAPDAVDWDGDGDLDLITSDETSGIFVLENVASSAKGPPVLESRGFLKAEDGRPIDVTWCAAPFFADVDGDDLPDLVSGHIAEEKKKFNWVAEPSLFFWKNTGTRSEPKGTRADFGFPTHWSDYPPGRDRSPRGGLERRRQAPRDPQLERRPSDHPPQP
jgi:hypothetical protein